MINVLDHGFVDLIQVLASDLTVANGARVSLASRSDVLSLKDEKLIDLLMRERHTVPFEHTLFTFHVKAPLVVAQHFLKHRISSISQQSGRYSVMEETFYLPDFVRGQTGSSMSYTYEALDIETTADVQEVLNIHNQMSYQMYLDLMEAGVAKEQARLVLPPTLYTEFWFTVNAHSLMNFLRLRNDKHAMFEIREFAKAIETMFAEQMPVSYRSFLAHGRPEFVKEDESTG